MPRARRPSPTSTPTARRVIAYVRVSTDKQAESGLGLEAQREKVRAYCALHDAELVRLCEDAGASASTLDRPALAEALAELAAGRADALLVLKLDRLTRSTRDLGDLLDRSQREGWALLSVSESLDTSTAAGRLVVGVLGAVAQWEREAIGERTAAAMAALAASGRYTGGTVPYGQRLAADGLHLEEDPARGGPPDRGRMTPPRLRLVRGGVDLARVEAALARLDRVLAEHGPPRRAPTAADLAAALGVPVADVRAALDLEEVPEAARLTGADGEPGA
jgi:site-specific DNA recombinase